MGKQILVHNPGEKNVHLVRGKVRAGEVVEHDEDNVKDAVEAGQLEVVTAKEAAKIGEGDAA